MKLVRPMAFALFGGISTAAAAAVAIQPSSSVGVMLTNNNNLQCNETDALLKVLFTIDESGWDNLYHKDDEYVWYKPEVRVHPSGNIGNSTLEESVEYETYDDVKDFEICIPRDGCLELTVYQFPFDNYDITYDGEKVDIDHEFQISKWGYGPTYPMSSTEIGESCKLECDDSKDEALFEYQFWGRDENDQYSVQDEKGDMILGCSRDDISLIYESFGLCSKSFYDFSVYKHRACLPRKSCYQFLTASRNEYSEYDWRMKQMMLSFDGNLLESSEAYFFKTIPFGNNCKPTCNPMNESSVELLLSHELRPEMNGNHSGSMSDDKAYVCESTPDMGPTWDLSVDNDEVSSGLIPYCSNQSLFREVVCLPRNGCGTFYISNSNETWGKISYSLTMDNVTHRSVGIYSGSFSNPNGWNETTNIGRCTVDGLCDASSQALFEVDLLTPTEYVSNDKSLPVIPSGFLQWAFGNSTREYSDWGSIPEPLLRSSDYVRSSYELGSIFRTIECVPNDQCVFDYNMTQESAAVLEKYEVRRNGMALSRVLVDNEGRLNYYFYSDKAREVTAFGENCNALSGGAIAGIVIGSIAVAAVIIAVYDFLWYKKKKEEVVAEDTNNPLTASLLAEAGGTERMTENSGDGTTP